MSGSQRGIVQPSSLVGSVSVNLFMDGPYVHVIDHPGNTGYHTITSDQYSAYCKAAAALRKVTDEIKAHLAATNQQPPFEATSELIRPAENAPAIIERVQGERRAIKPYATRPDGAPEVPVADENGYIAPTGRHTAVDTSQRRKGDYSILGLLDKDPAQKVDPVPTGEQPEVPARNADDDTVLVGILLPASKDGGEQNNPEPETSP